MNKKQKIFFLSIFLIVFAILVGFTVHLYAKAQEEKEKQTTLSQGNSGAEPAEELEKTITYEGTEYEYNRNIRTVLFLGIDKKEETVIQENAGRGGQSDCIIVMVMDTEKKTTTLLEISRDSMVDVEIYGINGDYLTTEKAQIALQYAYGNGEKKSCWLTEKAVSNLLYGIKMNSYVALNIAGISAITDAMGGVKITIPEDYTAIDPAFEQGAEVVLKGDQAERYVRYRDTSVTGSNNQRMKRQTEFIRALASQMKTDSSISQTAILNAAEPYMVTDMSADDIKALSEYELNEEILTVPGEVREGAEHDEFYVDDEALYRQILDLFYIPVQP